MNDLNGQLSPDQTCWDKIFLDRMNLICLGRTELKWTGLDEDRLRLG